jgi:acetylornithine deacetylase
MKRFLALAMNRLALADPNRLRHPLGLLFTFDEELGTLGAQHFAQTWPDPASLPRQVVIGEPTSLRPVRMHKGHLKLRVVLRGVSAHSGYPHLGRNAIEPAARAIVALTELRAQLEQERPANAEFFPEVPYVALNVGQVRGGVAVNVVPDRCEIDLGIRILPGMTSGTLIERVREALTRAIGADFELLEQGDSPPFLLDATRPIHAHVCAAAGHGDSASVSFATDAGWFQTVGFDCMIFGPGSIEVAHKPNEWLPIVEFCRADAMLDELIHRCCVSP